MPSLKTAAITAAILLVTLYLVVKFAPAGVASAVGLNKQA